MEVAILHPQDVLRRHQPHHHNHRHLISPAKPRRNPNPNPNPSNLNPNYRSNTNNSNNRRRRSSNSPPPSSGPAHKARPKSPPTMGQVRILKRGEDVPAVKPQPRPEIRGRALPGPIIDGFYAGSAFVTSPAPSEVPLPAFFTRRSCGGVGEAHNQEIASELRKVLKLQG